MFPFPFSFLGTSISAAFNYSASAYCQDASDPTPTITGTSGGTFSAAIKVVPFQMQFDTSGGKTITIPGTVGSSFTVDWGDGATTTETGGNISHTYASGIPTSIVSIGAFGDTGPFEKFAFNNTGSASDLLDVPQWGSIAWSGVNNMFFGCNNVNFQISATDYPDLTNITDMSYMFYNATHFNSNIDHWDVSTITNLYGFFRGCNNYNQSLNSWDVSNVANFSLMFYNTGNGSFNGNISSWDMSSCENTSNMFYNQASFNQDISGWNFSSSWTNASYMFYNLSSFNQNLNSWNVSSVQRMDGMFRGCTNFNNNGGTLSGWNVGSVTRMDRMFQSASSFVGTGVDSWNPSSCTKFDVMFYTASVFNQNLSSWSLSSLTQASSMFVGTNAFTTENYSDTVVGWAVFVYNNSGSPSSVSWVGTKPNFDGTRTSDLASGQTYVAKYGANWPSSWTNNNAQDAYDYLTTTLSWTIN